MGDVGAVRVIVPEEQICHQQECPGTVFAQALFFFKESLPRKICLGAYENLAIGSQLFQLKVLLIYWPIGYGSTSALQSYTYVYGVCILTRILLKSALLADFCDSLRSHSL